MPARKVTVMGTGAFFLAAFLLDAVALAYPYWVIHDFNGFTQFGLFTICAEQQYNGVRQMACGVTAESVPAGWTAAATLILLGLLLLAVAIGCTVLALVQSRYLDRAKWYAFAAATLFSLASLIFPIGFEGEPIGGQAFKLPEHSSVGFSYILFIVALLFLFVGELFAMHVLCAFD